MDCKKHVSSNSTFIKVNESSMYRDMGFAPAQISNSHTHHYTLISLKASGTSGGTLPVVAVWAGQTSVGGPVGGSGA